jgi:hypothetical protein
MSRSIDTLIAQVRSHVHQLLYADVIEHTIVVMRELGGALSQLASSVGRDASALNEQQKNDLKAILLPLTSESIREALHKGELPITNGIIRSKNQVLAALGVKIPDDHKEIDANRFPNYNW